MILKYEGLECEEITINYRKLGKKLGIDRLDFCVRNNRQKIIERDKKIVKNHKELVCMDIRLHQC